jgi:hypothetical protein
MTGHAAKDNMNFQRRDTENAKIAEKILNKLFTFFAFSREQ